MRVVGRKGQALIEFTFAAVPMIFLLISIEEMARGMLIYVTLANAVKEGTRYSVVHGSDCAQADSSCAITLGQVVSQIQHAAVGLDPGQLSLTLQSAGSSQSCAPLQTCLTNSANWPPAPDNSVGLPVTVSGTYPFVTPLSMFVPQAGSVKFQNMLFGASSREEIRY